MKMSQVHNLAHIELCSRRLGLVLCWDPIFLRL